jgi:acyl transferase domain-containing protein
MLKISIKYLLISGLILALSVTAFGQGGQPDNVTASVRSELERTDQVIERAQEFIQASNSVKAQVELEKAVGLQSQAWSLFYDGTTVSIAEAQELTRLAREMAKDALGNIRFAEQNGDVVLSRLERAQDLIERTKDQFSLQLNEQLQTLFESADDNLDKAWEFYRDGDFRPALKLANQVENTVRRIAGISSRDAESLDNFESYSESTKGMLEGARHKLSDCDSETAFKLMEQAESQFRQATELSSADKPQPAVEALQHAQKLATRAMMECGSMGNLTERYDKIKAEADQLSETITADDTEAKELLDEVYEQLTLAKSYIDSGDSEAAAASLKAARLTLNQVIKLLDGSDL